MVLVWRNTDSISQIHQPPDFPAIRYHNRHAIIISYIHYITAFSQNLPHCVVRIAKH